MRRLIDDCKIKKTDPRTMPFDAAPVIQGERIGALKGNRGSHTRDADDVLVLRAWEPPSISVPQGQGQGDARVRSSGEVAAREMVLRVEPNDGIRPLPDRDLHYVNSKEEIKNDVERPERIWKARTRSR